MNFKHLRPCTCPSGKPWNDEKITLSYAVVVTKNNSTQLQRIIICAILIKSEIQTISFYKKAAKMIHLKLSKSSPQVTSLMDRSSKFEMIAMDREHMNDRVKAFMTIRYLFI